MDSISNGKVPKSSNRDEVLLDLAQTIDIGVNNLRNGQATLATNED